MSGFSPRHDVKRSASLELRRTTSGHDEGGVHEGLHEVVGLHEDDDTLDAKDKAEILNYHVPFEVTRLKSTPAGKKYQPRTKVDRVALEHVIESSLYGLRRSRERKSVCHQLDTHTVPPSDIEKVVGELQGLRQLLKLKETNLLREASKWQQLDKGQALEQETLRKEQAASLLFDVTHHNSIYHKLDKRSMMLHRFVTNQSLTSFELLVILFHFCLTFFEYPYLSPRKYTTFKSMLVIELFIVLFYFALLAIRFSIDTRREYFIPPPDS
jgi:hypothetical protein